MNKQKICVIGAGLSGLITAFALSKLDISVDLIAESEVKNSTTNRTTAISQNNYNFLKRLNVSNFPQKEFWPCSEMEIYSANGAEKYKKIFDLKNENNTSEKILYMVKNSKIIDYLLKNIKKNSLIKIKNKKKVLQIENEEFLNVIKFGDNNGLKKKYNLIIVCTGNNLNFLKKKFAQDKLERSYKEIAITTILKHKTVKNKIARQIFFKDSIFAILPISKNKSSIVWSLNKKDLSSNKTKLNKFLKKKIKDHTRKFLRGVVFISKIEFGNLNLLIRKNYFDERILLFGDTLHLVHPLTGQGFNMVLRDLQILEGILKEKIKLGLDIGSFDILSEFSMKAKYKNFIYSLGIDFLKNFFSLKQDSLNSLRNRIVIKANKNNFFKKQIIKIANQGINF